MAEGSPEVWVDIARSNRAALVEELCSYRERLDALLAALGDDDFDRLGLQLADARQKRRAIMQARPCKEYAE